MNPSDSHLPHRLVEILHLRSTIPDEVPNSPEQCRLQINQHGLIKKNKKKGIRCYRQGVALIRSKIPGINVGCLSISEPESQKTSGRLNLTISGKQMSEFHRKGSNGASSVLPKGLISTKGFFFLFSRLLIRAALTGSSSERTERRSTGG